MAACVAEKRVDGGTVRVYAPQRTPEQEREFWSRLDKAVRKACPGRRLKGGETHG